MLCILWLFLIISIWVYKKDPSPGLTVVHGGLAQHTIGTCAKQLLYLQPAIDMYWNDVHGYHCESKPLVVVNTDHCGLKGLGGGNGSKVERCMICVGVVWMTSDHFGSLWESEPIHATTTAALEWLWLQQCSSLLLAHGLQGGSNQPKIYLFQVPNEASSHISGAVPIFPGDIQVFNISSTLILGRGTSATYSISYSANRHTSINLGIIQSSSSSPVTLVTNYFQ